MARWRRHQLFWVMAVLAGFAPMVTLAAGTEDDPPLADKTLVVWVSPADLRNPVATALTVNDTTMDRFDGVIFAEIEPRVWMPGSNGYSRTSQDQAAWPKETEAAGKFVQMAIVYQGQHVTILSQWRAIRRVHNERATARIRDEHGRRAWPAPSVAGSRLLLWTGARCSDHARPLDQPTIAAMQPGQPVEDIEPWAWWDFATTGTYDRVGRFNQVKLAGGARIEDGCLVLDGTRPTMLATTVGDGASTAEIPSDWSQRRSGSPGVVVQSTRLFREKLLADPYRPGYHFCVPEDNGRPGDPNGCFYANGRYHLMYLYNRSGVGFCWGHISSQDLVHWRHHPDAIGPGDGDEGCFSGGAFVDDDGTAYLSYWMLWGDKGIGLAKSSDRYYDHWQKLAANPVIKSTEWGITETGPGGPETGSTVRPIRPTSGRRMASTYILTGNLLVLNKYGRQSDSPESMKGIACTCSNRAT